MTNQRLPNYQFVPTRQGSVGQRDLFTDRDVVYGRQQPTPNTLYFQETRDPKVLMWTMSINDLSAGLGNTRMSLGEVFPGYVTGQLEGAPLDMRYVDKANLPLIRRHFASPALGLTTPPDPSHRAESSNTGTGTTATGNAPTGMAAGDNLVAFVIHNDASTNVSAVPSGWNLRQVASPGPTGDFKVHMYTKVALAADVSAGTWAWTLSASERWRVIVAAAQNGDSAGAGASVQKYVKSATRFYFPSSGAAPIEVPLDSDWNIANAEVIVRHFASYPIPTETPFKDTGLDDENSSDRNVAIFQYVVAQPLAAQTISAQTVKIQMRGWERSSSVNMALAWGIRVIAPDGAVRGTVLEVTRDGTELSVFPTIQNRGDSATSTEVEAEEGDFLVFEIGAGGNPSGGEDHAFELVHGDSGSGDLPENNTSTASLNPWIEFANEISFEDDVNDISVAVPVTRPGSLVYSLAAIDADSLSFTGATDTGGSITEELDSAANAISAALYSESVSAVSNVTHTLTRSGGTTDLAALAVVIPPAPYGKRLSHLNLDGEMLIAQGDANLIREIAEGTPSLESTGFAPPSVVNALHALIVGGSTANARPAVCMSDDPIKILDGISSNPASVDDMHADTEPGWGIIQGSGYTGDISVYANNSMALGNRASAIDQTLTVKLSNVPNGGAAIGQLHLPGAEIRNYWLIPLQDCGTQQANVLGVPMKIMSTNIFADLPQDLWVPFWASYGGIATFTDAVAWQQGMVMTDTFRVLFHRGRTEPMNWPGDRPGLEGAGQLLCRGLWVRGEKLVILVQRVAIYGGSGTSLWWMEEYDERTGAFYQISSIVDSGKVGEILGANAAGQGLPFSNQSNCLYWHDDEEWSQLLATDLLRSPYTHLRGISGGGGHQGFEANAASTMPEMIIREGLPSLVSEFRFIGDVDGGGTGATVVTEATEQVGSDLVFTGKVRSSFYEGDRLDRHVQKFPHNESSFNRMQLRFTANRGADANQTPQVLPVIVKGLLFLDGKVKKPIDVLGVEWANSPY